MASITEEPHPAARRGIGSTAVSSLLAHPLLLLLGILLVLPWVLVAYLLGGGAGHASRPPAAAAAASASPRVVTAKPGPWGHMEYIPMSIDLPDEFVFVPPPDHPPIRWFFQGYTKDKVIGLLRTSGLAEGQIDKLLQKASWSEETEGTSVEPGDELILDISPATREKLYTVLVEFPQNNRQIDPIWFRTGQVDERMEDSGLLPSSVELLKSLLYPHGSSLLLFADFEPAVRRLPDEHERRQFMKTVSRKETLLARVKIDADTDVESLANYWGVGGRRKDLVPFLNSLRRIEKGCKLNIVYLLPHFARDRLYNHPYTPADPAGKKQDCFWSAFNLFNETTDDRFCNMDFVGQAIKTDYYSILEPTQLGDLVFLTTHADTVVHAAAFLADDIVFTKNGESYTQPWILMHLDDMVNTYAVRHPVSGPLKVLYYRKKTL